MHVRIGRCVGNWCVVIVAAVALAGCGGGGGGNLAATTPAGAAPVGGAPTASGTAASGTGRFTPNYAGNLETLLHWPMADLLVYIAPDTSGRGLDTLARRGFEMWTEETGGRIRFQFTQDPGSAALANIAVEFVAHESLGGRVIGLTNTSYDTGSLNIRRAEIAIDQSLPDTDLIDTTVHEVGHALGIGGHSPSQEDVMYPISMPPARITVNDVNTIKTAYPWLFDGRSLPPTSRAGGETRTLTITCPRH